LQRRRFVDLARIGLGRPLRLTIIRLICRRILAGGGLTLTKATLAALATFWAPAGAAELQSYTVTVLEQIRYNITVEANEESAARTLALLEARRTSRFAKPAWRPSPPAVLARTREADDFAVIKVEPLFRLDAHEVAAP
jgi:hypothetical protein